MKLSAWPDSVGSAPGLRAVAQPGTIWALEFSRTVWSAPFVNEGTWFTWVTVITNVCVALVSTPLFRTPPLSWSLTETVALPLRFATAVKVRVPVGEIWGWAEKRALASLVTMKLRVWPDSRGPSLIAVAQPVNDCAPAFSRTVLSPPLVNDGASFTAVTVIVIVWVALVSEPPLAVPPLSWSLTDTVARPLAFAARV